MWGLLYDLTIIFLSTPAIVHMVVGCVISGRLFYEADCAVENMKEATFVTAVKLTNINTYMVRTMSDIV